MQDDLTGATSTPADDSVRADLESAFADWKPEDEFSAPSAKEPAEAATEAEAQPAPDEGEPSKQPSGERNRDEKGRFAKKEGDEAQEGQQPPPPDVTAEAETQPDPEPEPEPQAEPVEGKPPPGWSIKSKAAWDQLPPHIRADIVKREEEVNNGFVKLRDYKGLEPFANMARQSGTTLEDAVRNYVGMEQLLRRDFKQGVIAIAQNMGVAPQQLQQIFGGPAPAAQPHQNGHANGATDQNLSQDDLNDPYVKAIIENALRPVTQELNTLKTTFQSRAEADQQREQTAAQKIVDEFRASDQYRYFSDVEGTINDLIQKGMIEFSGDYRTDLATAYDMACQLNPEVREALINERLSKAEEKRKAEAAKADADRRAKADAAKRAAVSVRGAPSGPVSMPVNSKGSVRDDLEAAWSEHS